MNGDIARCPSCAARTCIKCKRPTLGQEHRPIVELNGVLGPTEEGGGKPCPKCGVLVKLVEGREHIT